MTDFGKDLIQAMTEAVDHAEGRLNEGVRITEFEPLEIKTIRGDLGVTQKTMAKWLGISVSGYRKWEQGQAKPRGAAKTLLTLMKNDPESILRGMRA